MLFFSLMTKLSKCLKTMQELIVIFPRDQGFQCRNVGNHNMLTILSCSSDENY